MSRHPSLLQDPIVVLHVDDDEQMRTLLRDSLERVEGAFDVRSVGEPARAIDRLDGSVDCIVSDYEMPRMNGLELLQTVREDWPDLPFILLTGRGSESVASEAVSAGLTDYFRKSDIAGKLPVLAQRIETAVERMRAEVSYRELFRKAVDGIALNDPETGAFIDANPAFREIVGLDRSELLAMRISGIRTIPPQHEQDVTLLDRLQMAAKGDDTSTEECSWRTDGERFWMELQFKPIEIKGRTFVLTQVREITDRKRYEQTLSALHAAVTDIVGAEKPRQVTGSVLSTVEDLLAADRAAVFRHDSDENWLAVVDATSPDGVVSEIQLDTDHPVARAFVNGEPVDIDSSLFEHDGTETPGHAVALPIGTVGVLVIEYDETQSFDEDDREFARILTNAAAAAFERIEKEREAHSKQAALREQTDELQQLERLNATLRGLNETLFHTDTRTEVFEAVCDHLSRIEGVKLAWIGTATDGEHLERHAWAGDIPQYLDAVPLELDGSDEPAVVAMRTGTRVHVENTATGLNGEPWRRAALAHGVESVMAVPIEVGGATDAVLSLLATDRTTFDTQFADLLSTVAATVGETLHSIEQRQGVQSDETVELEFGIPAESHVLGRLAASTDATFDVQGVIPEAGNRSRVFLAVEGVDPQRVEDAATSTSAIHEATVAAIDGAESAVELSLEIPILGTAIREYAVGLTELSATAETVRVGVDVEQGLSLVYEASSSADGVFRDQRVPLRSTTARVGQDGQPVNTTVSIEITEVARTLAAMREGIGDAGRVNAYLHVETVYDSSDYEGSLADRVALSVSDDASRLPTMALSENHHTTRLVTQPAQQQVFGLTLPALGTVVVPHWTPLFGVLAVLGGLAVSAARYGRGEFSVDRERDTIHRLRYDEWISVGTLPGTLAAHPLVVPMESLEALVDVAIDSDTRVVYDREQDCYAVLTAGALYVFATDPEPESDMAPEIDDSMPNDA